MSELTPCSIITESKIIELFASSSFVGEACVFFFNFFPSMCESALWKIKKILFFKFLNLWKKTNKIYKEKIKK